MKIAVFSAKPYDIEYFEAANAQGEHEFVFLEHRLTTETAQLAAGCDVVCPFVNDHAHERVLKVLVENDIKLLALRSAGYSHVNLRAAEKLGLTVARVPAYSPNAVAEHTLALMMALNRKIVRAYNRVREGNFSLDGLMGFDMAGKTVGIVGTGRIGFTLAKIMAGLGCKLVTYDIMVNPGCIELGANYVELGELLEQSDMIALTCPLTPETHHMINEKTIAQMKPGVMLVNTSRGGLIDTAAVIEGLRTRKIGSLGLDVYEEEGQLFFKDLSGSGIPDDIFARLVTFPNVLITGHQGFFTKEAMQAIAEVTLANISAFAQKGAPLYPVAAE